MRQLDLPGPALPRPLDAEARFHYRNLDVSTLKELVRRSEPEAMEGLVKEGKHQALVLPQLKQSHSSDVMTGPAQARERRTF